MGRRILSIGGNTFQFFTKNPRGKTQTKAPDPEDVQALCRLIEENGMTPPLAHAPYTYNPCSADEGVRQYSGDSMKKELEFLEAIPGARYNFHPGCHVGQGAEAGMQMVADMLNRILWKGMKTTVLIETMAGKGTELGRDFEEMRRMLDLIHPDVREHVGVCLDTCHIQDAGYNLEKDTDGVIAEFDRTVGLENIHAIHDRAFADFSCMGMGSTLVGLLVNGKKACVVNVGDSRAYLLTKRSVEQITRDHSLVEDMVSRGKITRAEAQNHPKKNIITRAVGVEASVTSDLFDVRFTPGSRIILCSDGLSNLVSGEEMLIVSNNHADVQEACEALLELALKRGAPDNVTAFIAER